MNLFSLSWSNLIAKPLSTILSLLLLTLGVSIISLVLLLDKQIQDSFNKNVRGIDMVVGAKGSPLQLILASVYHIDAPTGNIPLKEADDLRKHPLIEKAIPLAYGDNYKGFRIVGTDTSYIQHYEGKLANGRYWDKTLETTIGATVANNTGLKIGDSFYGAHGLIGEGDIHDDIEYTVVGILAPSNTVLDQLVLTDVTSVWEIHNHDHDHEGEHAEGEHDHEDGEEHDHDHEGEHAEGEHDHEDGEEHEHDHEGEHAEGEHDHEDGEEHDHDHEGEHTEGEHDHEDGEKHEHDHDHEGEHAEGEHDHEDGEEHDHDHEEEHAEGEHDHEDGEEHDHDHEGEHAEGEHDHEDGEEHDHDHEGEQIEEEREITALLISFKNPLGNVTLPRVINENTSMMAALPAIEINRLFSLLGIGIDLLRFLAITIIIISGVSVFISLYNSLKDRKYELALMRTMGAYRISLFQMIIQEGLILSVLGFSLGFLLSRLSLIFLSNIVSDTYHYDFSQMGILQGEFVLFGATLIIGFLAASIPALQAYNTNISNTLSDA